MKLPGSLGSYLVVVGIVFFCIFFWGLFHGLVTLVACFLTWHAGQKDEWHAGM